MKITADHIKVGRVLHEDDGFLTVEVAKDNNRPLRLETGDRFLTVLFVRAKTAGDEPNQAEAWLPWNEEA